MYKENLNLIKNHWKALCENHIILYNQTKKEYSLLIESNITKLEEILQIKSKIIININNINNQRNKAILSFINELKEENSSIEINNFQDLVDNVKSKSDTNYINELIELNNMLIKVIKKIQIQNKKNQLLLNKSIIFINSLKDEFLGKNSSFIYKKKGSDINLISKTT